MYPPLLNLWSRCVLRLPLRLSPFSPVSASAIVGMTFSSRATRHPAINFDLIKKVLFSVPCIRCLHQHHVATLNDFVVKSTHSMVRRFFNPRPRPGILHRSGRHNIFMFLPAYLFHARSLVSKQYVVLSFRTLIRRLGINWLQRRVPACVGPLTSIF